MLGNMYIIDMLPDFINKKKMTKVYFSSIFLICYYIEKLAFCIIYLKSKWRHSLNHFVKNGVINSNFLDYL